MADKHADDNIGDAFPDAETRTRSAARDEQPDPPDDARQSADTLPVALIYTSRTDGLPHLVSVADDPRGRRLQCVCKSAAIRGDCWAVQETRRLFGWPELERT